MSGLPQVLGVVAVGGAVGLGIVFALRGPLTRRRERRERARRHEAWRSVARRLLLPVDNEAELAFGDLDKAPHPELGTPIRVSQGPETHAVLVRAPAPGGVTLCIRTDASEAPRHIEPLLESVMELGGDAARWIGLLTPDVRGELLAIGLERQLEIRDGCVTTWSQQEADPQSAYDLVARTARLAKHLAAAAEDLSPATIVARADVGLLHERGGRLAILHADPAYREAIDALAAEAEDDSVTRLALAIGRDERAWLREHHPHFKAALLVQMVRAVARLQHKTEDATLLELNARIDQAVAQALATQPRPAPDESLEAGMERARAVADEAMATPPVRDAALAAAATLLA